MTQRAFESQLAVSAVALLAGALGEAVASARAVASPAAAASVAAWTLGLWALPALLLALLLAWLLAALFDDGSLAGSVFALRERPAHRDAALLALGGAALLAAWVFGSARWLMAFHNRELAAALLALAALAGVLVLGSIGFLIGRSWRGGPKRAAWGWLSGAVSLLSGAWIAASCRDGLAQLDPRLGLAPSAFVLAFVLADRVARVRRHARFSLLVSSGVLLACWGAFLAAGARASQAVAVHGAWSRPLIGALQRLSDFDRDGYSSFLGGGDCAPFDARVSPGATEIAGDGVDNNCIGGDAGQAAAPRRPVWGASAHGALPDLNLIVVTIETLRRDHASFLSAARDTTPVLRGLASSSLVFERMYSAAPYTRLALASLFSSYAPSEIDWQQLGPEKHRRHIGPRTPWLPELLQARGYETIAVLADFSAFTPEEAIGFERGFRHYDVSTPLEYRGGTLRGFPAGEQVNKALDYVRGASRPFMLWLHLFEPHYRYEQPPGAPVFGTDEQSRYDAEIWYADQQLGRLIAGLRQLGLWDASVLFVSGDHGEAFGEHDDRWHGTNLFDPQLRPAALLRVPGVSGKRLDVSVTFTDMAPTFARVLGDRQTFDRLRGRSLAPLLHHPSLPEGENSFVAETFNVQDGRAYQAALIAYPLKLIYVEQGRSFSLFDLSVDPRELRPIEPSSDPRGAPLLRELVGYLERARPRTLGAR